MESYIVRIYRRDPGDAVAGVVEDALSRRRIAFRTLAELAEWLRCPRPLRRTGRGSAGPGHGDAAS